MAENNIISLEHNCKIVQSPLPTIRMKEPVEPPSSPIQRFATYLFAIYTT